MQQNLPAKPQKLKLSDVDPDIIETIQDAVNRYNQTDGDISVFLEQAEEIRELTKVPESPLGRARFKAILNAIQSGIVSPLQIAATIGTNRGTVSNYLNQYPILTMLLEEQVMGQVDQVEAETFRNAITDPRAAPERMFLLRNWKSDQYNRDRRSTKNQTINGNMNQITINVGTTNITQIAQKSDNTAGRAIDVTDAELLSD
jgi:hypothetical protein